MGLYASITPESGGDEIVLCDSPDPIPSFNFRINNSRVLQVNRFYQADFQKVRGRGNKLNRISFEVPARVVDGAGAEFDNAAGALGFALDHVNEVPDIGLLTLIITDGSTTVERYFDNAGIESAELTGHRGMRLAFAYTITAGIMLTEAP